MYGNSTIDPVVKYYDISFALGGSEEIQFYIDKVRQYGGPVLDLACGTGRLSIEFAKLGYDVTAIDNSEGMIELFNSKLEELEELSGNIDIHFGKFNDYSFNKKFKTIICSDAIFHNLNIAELRSFFRCAKNHLDKDGCLVFNMHNPNPHFLVWAASDESSEYRTRSEYPVPNSSNILVIQEKLDVDLLNQIINTELKFILKDISGDVIEEAYSNWKTRYIFRYEAEYLMELMGLKVIDLVGNYLNEPISINSQLIFTVGDMD